MTIDDVRLEMYLLCADFSKLDHEKIRRSLAKLVLESRMNPELVREAQQILAAPKDAI